MSTPVTRGELRTELEQFRQQLEQRLALLATKAELEIWGGALLARIEPGEQRLYERIESGEQQLSERIKSSEQQLSERIDRTAQELHVDLARHATALYESMATLISASDEKYEDLPGRVSRLEARVFAPKQVL
jgi:hypothetical protein